MDNIVEMIQIGYEWKPTNRLSFKDVFENDEWKNIIRDRGEQKHPNR